MQKLIAPPVFALICGCDSRKEPAKEPSAQPAAASPDVEKLPAKSAQPTVASPALEIVPAKLVVKRPAAGETISLELRDGGDIVLGEKVVARVTADGTMTDPAGHAVASIGSDGSIAIVGQPEPLVLSADGVVRDKGKEVVRFDPGGRLVSTSSTFDPGKKVIALEGPSGAVGSGISDA